LANKESSRLTGLLERQLDELERYGKLVEEQEVLIEREDYSKLNRLLERKAKIISRMEKMEDLSSLAERAAKQGGESAEYAAGLLMRLLERLNFFAGRERECLEKAFSIREDIAGGLHALRKGKKLLHEYTRFSREPKAKFKDIKT